MQNNSLVPVSIGSDALQELQANLQALEELLSSNIIGLSIKERMRLTKVSDGSEPFVDKALAYSKTNPEFAPIYVGIEDFGEEVAVFKALRAIKKSIFQIGQNLDDTTMKAGSVVYLKSRLYYQSVKRAAKEGVPNAKPIYEDMKQRFRGQGRYANKVEATPNGIPLGPPGDLD